jgi:hypothetical protein
MQILVAQKETLEKSCVIITLLCNMVYKIIFMRITCAYLHSGNCGIRKKKNSHHKI